MKRELNPCQGWSLKNQLLIEYVLFTALFFFTSLKFVQGGKKKLLRLSLGPMGPMVSPLRR